MNLLKENRAAVIALYNAGNSRSSILKLLQNNGAKKTFIYNTIKRYEDTGTTDDRPRSGRPRTVRTKSMLKALKARIRRNPCRKQKKLAIQMKTSARTMSRALRDDLKLKALKRCTSHFLNLRLRAQRKIKCSALLKRYTPEEVNNILFTDEKIFTVEEHFNRQNDRVYAKCSKDIPPTSKRVLRIHHPAQLMVWAGVSAVGLPDLHFCETGVKTQAKNYQSDILDKVVLPLNNTLFAGKHWTFQQDSAPAHKAKTTQRWLKDNIPDFISSDDWPASSPDLNPLDYKIWSVLEEMACSKPHTNLETLKKSLTKSWKKFPMNVVRAAVGEWRDRLKCCVKSKGGHFEV